MFPFVLQMSYKLTYISEEEKPFCIKEMGWGKETMAIRLHYDTLNTEIFF